MVFSVAASAAIYVAGQAASDRIFLVLNAVGSIYLIYLGAFVILRGTRPRPQRTAPAPSALGPARMVSLAGFPSGFLVNLANAKSALFFGSVFATTMPLSAMALSDYALVIAMFFLNSALAHGIVATFFAAPIMRGVIRPPARDFISLRIGLPLLRLRLAHPFTARVIAGAPARRRPQ